MIPPDLVPVAIIIGVVGFIFFRLHGLMEPAKPMPTPDELASRDTEEMYKEGSSLVWPFLIFANKPRRMAVARGDTSSIARGIALLEGVIARTHGNWPAEWCVGKAYQATGRADEAIRHFGNAFRLNPKHPDVAREYIAECLVLGRGEDAVEASKVICDMHPDDAGLRANLAYARLIAGDVAGEIRDIDQAIAKDPSDQVTINLREFIMSVHEGKTPRPTRISHPK